tara:strand:- start:16954 stop:17880 length:927 start_codon:yes stop_codon:yes gene_type:complete
MNKIFIVLILFGLISCKDNKSQEKQNDVVKAELLEIIKEDYELYKPVQQAKAVLILFGGYPENAADIKREFSILEIAKNNDIAVLLLNYNQKLWLEENEKYQLAKQLQEIIENNELPSDTIFIGGFSSGGVVSLLISNYIVGMKQFYIDPKGVFIIDSPIDLVALYTSSEKNIERNFSEISIQESNWIIETLGSTFGNPNDELKKYENKSVFTYRSNNTNNVQKLKNTKIRLYTEPDTLWWKKHRMADFEQMNAFYIKKLSERLKEQGFENVEYIATHNKGYRANGERHPHSWAIVDKKDLIDWILKK